MHGKEKCRNATQSLSGKPEAKIARKAREQMVR
jgi:hypothetical protein